MFKFEKEQSVWDFNGTKLGGQPGIVPDCISGLNLLQQAGDRA